MRMTVGLLLRCNCEDTEQLRCDVTMQQAAFRIYWLLVISREAFFVSEGHRKPETYPANLCDQHKFCASLSVLLGTEWTVISREQQAKRFKNLLCF